ncbi:phospholipase A2 inhibitor NAI-like [Eublepharis macularius]|uniref:Phospholipase A2 inhibitor NAI-like n=1 Tax=Eublepharis macularius TaxID=481883 RepID=A0AA97KGB0_EUBMA|nr:phospholipase A2 inhibitor NAI-like [Eublepharis macularius]
MEALLEIFLFSLLVTLGTSLQCETCSAVGKSCSGLPMTCSASHDTCSFSLAETSIVGHGGEILCCTGLSCALASPQLPPINATANGKQCPGCYSFAGSCVPEVAYCTGSENYCFDALIHKYDGSFRAESGPHRGMIQPFGECGSTPGLPFNLRDDITSWRDAEASIG